MDKINAKVFLTVVETGSFRKAAEVLDYTQAGVSYIISAMEEAVGLNLFVREHGGVRLSREGRTLMPYMQQLEAWEHRFMQTVNELNGLEKGVVRVQIFDSISIHWVPNIVRNFQADFPNIQIELISEEDPIRTEQMVLNGEVDCGFFWSDVTSKIDVFPLLEESLMAVVGPEHPMAKLEKFPIASLGEYPFISMRIDANTAIGAIFRKRGITPKTVFSMDNDFAAISMVSKGLGYGIFPELLLRDIPYNVKCMQLDEPQRRTISIGTRSMKNCSRACCTFIEYTRNWVKEEYKNEAFRR